jgi:TRAP-type C4-dicarboxylate transport system permease small subunit
MKLIRSIDSAIGKVVSAILISLLAVMLLMGFTQVVLRNFFSTGILWADVLLRHVVLWVAFLGAIVATGERRHITIDALTKVLSERGRKIAGIVTGIASVIVSYYLTNASYRFLIDEMEFGGTLILDIPIWIFQLIIPLGFGLMMLRFGMHVLGDTFELLGRPAPTEGGKHD